MLSRPSRTAVGILLLFGLATTVGCTRSLEMSYTPSLYRLPRAEQLGGIVLGVGKLEDRRSWIERSDPESQSYVMQSGPWRFGLTYKAKEFVPVADLVQSLLVDEFNRAGVAARPLPAVLTKDDTAAMSAAGQQHGAGYALGGRVHVFEIVNEQGFWTVTSRRAITLEIHVLQVTAGTLLVDSTVTHNDRQNEGMGVLHSTNVDRLMNTVFRQVVTQVVEQVAAKLAMDPGDIGVRVTLVEAAAGVP
ncbi:MAG TPA: hypothetical protein VIE36_03195 [Methylomirabilota bacterium]|jgi:hypothetical protein